MLKHQVTFATSCYEKDYKYVLNKKHLKKMVANCNYTFKKRIVLINNVNCDETVRKMAEKCKKKNLIDEYFFVSNYIKKTLKFFDLTKEDLKCGYKYSAPSLTSIYLCKTDYILYFTGDAYIKRKNNSNWIKKGIELMEKNHQYACANPFWNKRKPKISDGFIEKKDSWFIGHSFSDQCFLAPMRIFKNKIYKETNELSKNYPQYATDGFERKVDSYMRNNNLLRLTNKNIDYNHKLEALTIKEYTKKIYIKLINLYKKINTKDLQEHRKNIKIYDIFTFFNELDLLEIRLNILDKYVDYFVIVEATETFSGKPKKLYYQENKHLFKKFEQKIIHYVIDDTPKNKQDLENRLSKKNLTKLDREIISKTLNTKSIPKDQNHWLKEFYQKEYIRKAIINIPDEDICFISDLDEIWNPKVKINYSQNKIFKLKQLMYTYFLNNRSSETWKGTITTKYKNIKNKSVNYLDNPIKTKHKFVKNGGWHFTNIGGVEMIKKKLESYGHQEYNNNEIKSQIEKRMENNEDFIGRKFKFWVDEKDLPEYLLKNKDKYKKLFK